MNNLTVDLGCQGDSQTVTIHWFDHNNIHYMEVLEINVLDQDKPRTLTVTINERCVWRKNDRGETYAPSSDR